MALSSSDSGDFGLNPSGDDLFFFFIFIFPLSGGQDILGSNPSGTTNGADMT
jgi:hypothetical protein